MDRVRKLSAEVLEKYGDEFSENFADNKKVLSEISVITSKELKNKIAGFITKTKRRTREEKESADAESVEDAESGVESGETAGAEDAAGVVESKAESETSGDTPEDKKSE